MFCLLRRVDGTRRDVAVSYGGAVELPQGIVVMEGKIFEEMAVSSGIHVFFMINTVPKRRISVYENAGFGGKLIRIFTLYETIDGDNLVAACNIFPAVFIAHKGKAGRLLPQAACGIGRNLHLLAYFILLKNRI